MLLVNDTSLLYSKCKAKNVCSFITILHAMVNALQCSRYRNLFDLKINYLYRIKQATDTPLVTRVQNVMMLFNLRSDSHIPAL